MLFILHTYLFQGYNYLPPFTLHNLHGHQRFNILRIIWEPYMGTYKKKNKIKRVLLTFELAQKARALHS